MFFDTHCHTYLLKNEKEILNKIQQNWNLKIITMWVDLETSTNLLETISNYDFMYWWVWIYPCDIVKYNDLEDTIQKLEILAKHKKVLAIWECGLDYYWLEKDLREKYEDKNIFEYEFEKWKQNQKKWFKTQINLAKKYDLPLSIHNRLAKEDLFDILKEKNCKNFIMHCFCEDYDFAKKLLDFSPNCKISFSWMITFKNTENIQETAKKIPLKNIIIETDSPYLTPIPFRWQENNPFFVEKVFNKICELRSEDPETIKKTIWKNSLEVFKK